MDRVSQWDQRVAQLEEGCQDMDVLRFSDIYSSYHPPGPRLPHVKLEYASRHYTHLSL